MKNIDVIRAFLNNRTAKTQNLSTDGTALVNYATTIGYWYDGELFINKQRYSVTTSKIQNWLVRDAIATGVCTHIVTSVDGCDGLVKFAKEYKLEGAGA